MFRRFVVMAMGGMLVWGLTLGGGKANTQAGPSASGHRGRGEQMSPDRQLERLSETLDLTDDQKSQIRPILEDRHQKMESIRSDTSLSEQDRRSKMRSIFVDSNNKIRAVLNDDQKQKFDQMQQRGRERMQKHSGSDNH